MLARILMAMLAFLPFASTVEAGLLDRIVLGQPKVAPTTTIKVLIADNKDGVVIETKGRYKLYNPENGKLIATRFNGKRKYMQGLVDGLKWGEEFPALHQILIMPDSAETTVVVDGIEYSGSVYVYDIGGYISVVNEVAIEDYIASILGPQYKEPLPVEMLAAVAITARTTAFYHVQNPKSAFWAVEADKVGYQGVVMARSSSPNMEEALKATKGMVLSQGEGRALTPFMAGWGMGEAGMRQSSIPMSQAEAWAQNGKDAGQILSQAFPGASIQLIQK